MIIQNEAAIRSHPALFPADVLPKTDAVNSSEQFQVEVAKTGARSFSFTHENKQVFMHSAYDPEKEARTIAAELADERIDIVAIIGIGAGYLVREARRTRPDIPMLIVEPQYETFRFITDTFDLSDIFSDSHNCYFVGDDVLSDIEQFLARTPKRNLKIVTLRGYQRLYPDAVKDITREMLSIVDKKQINVNTIHRFEKLWAHNIMTNIRTLPFSHGVRHLFDACNDVPVIVVSAGPSLENNIELLHEAKKKALIIAVDTVLKPLAHHGIVPHITCAIDPQVKNARYFRGVPTKDTILVAESSIHNEVLRHFEGPVLLVASVFPLARYVMRHFAPHGEMNMGGSVSTGAFDIARKAGGNPLLMLGLDLSFPEHVTHIKGSYHEENFMTQVSKLDTFEGRIYQVLIEGGLRPETDIHGNRVFTDARFTMYRNWYERELKRMPNTTVYNCSEGGIAVAGMENRTLRSVLDELPERNIDLSPIFELSKLNDTERAFIRDEIRDDFHSIQNEIREIESLASEGLALIESVNKKIHRHEPIRDELARLEAIDAQMLSLEEAKLFVGITMQKAINTIAEQAATGDEFASLENSRYLYDSLLHSAAYNLRLLVMGIQKLSHIS